jgi:hypothetical protein
MLKASSDPVVFVFCQCIGTHCLKSVSFYSALNPRTLLTTRDQNCHLETQLLGYGANNWDVVDQCRIPGIRSVIAPSYPFSLMGVDLSINRYRNGEHLIGSFINEQ